MLERYSEDLPSSSAVSEDSESEPTQDSQETSSNQEKESSDRGERRDLQVDIGLIN